MALRCPAFSAPSAIRFGRRAAFCYNFAFCCGGIAQLGERLHGMQEVSGSIPLTSTTDLVAALGLMATTALPVPIV